MGKTMSPIFLCCSLSDPFNACRYDNIHESLDEFEIQSNLIRERRVSCS